MKYQNEGFPNQRLFRLPDELARRARSLPICRTLTVTDTGYFPESAGHRVDRPLGSPTSILLFCVGGRGWLHTPHGNDDLHPGDLCWIPARTPHHYGAATETPWRLYWLHLSGSLLPEWDHWIPQPPSGIRRWRVSDIGGLAEQFESLWRLQDDGGSDLSLLRMSCQAQALLAHAVAARVSDQARTRHLEQRIERSVLWMRENLHRPVSLAECARAAGISPSHYSAIFRDSTGVSPLKYFNRLRLRRASEWLDENNATIQQIADRLGYANPFHFSRAFHRFTGLSPRAYRNRLHTSGTTTPHPPPA